jgi:hypothetical protein
VTNQPDSTSGILAACESAGVATSVALDFLESLMAHICYVQEAGRKLGVSEEQLRRHDNSKYSLAEFPAYAQHFKGGGAPDAFAIAWLHHIHANPHHHEHWRFTDGYTPKGSTVENGCVFMPNNYALEMIADWMGASMAYTGSWDMKDWLWKNLGRIHVHSKTAQYLREQLGALGYTDVVSACQFGHEAKAQKVDASAIDWKGNGLRGVKVAGINA